MNKSKFILFVALFAISFTFFACSNDESGDRQEANGSENLCMGEEYDPNIYRCESGELVGKCAGVDYFPAYQTCNNGKIEDLEGGDIGTSSSSDGTPVECDKDLEKIFLGMGYNVVTSAYINHDDVIKSNLILDQNKLCQAGIIVSAPAPDQDFSISVGKSIAEFYKERNTKIGVEATFFSGGIAAKFDEARNESATSQVYYGQLRSYIYETEDRINTNTQNLSDYLSSEFASALKNKTPEQIIKDYGTHVFIRYKKGGTMEANYTYSGTEIKDTEQLRTAINGNYLFVKGNASTFDKQSEFSKSENMFFNFRTYGGKSLDALSFEALTKDSYSDWTNSIETESTICGIGSFNESLIPIWELARDAGETAKATALETAFNKLVQDQGIAFPKARIFETYNIPFSGTGTLTDYNVFKDCAECTVVEFEVYALGAGGGGQGGNYSFEYFGFTEEGTGGAGGGGTATYARLGRLGLVKGQPLIFNSISIGNGGTQGKFSTVSDESGGIADDGEKTEVNYKGAIITANGGSGAGGRDTYTTGGAAGLTSSLPTSSNYYIEGHHGTGASKGSNGNWEQDLLSTGGKAATITNIGTIKSFGGDNGAVRYQGSSNPTAPGNGGGGSGGFSMKDGINGGDGLLTIVVKYYKEEGKVGTGSSDVINTSSSLLWDTSIGFGLLTGGGWYTYNDQIANAGNSIILLRDKTDNQYYTSNNVMEWDGTASFSIDPNGFEYAYAGAGFAWLESGTVAPNVWGNHTGVCLEYSLSGGGDYYLRIATTEGYTGDNEYKVELPKQASVAKKFFSFNSFEQADWGTDFEYYRTLAQAKQNSIGMQIQGEAPLLGYGFDGTGYTTTQTGTLTLKSMSWDSCN